MKKYCEMSREELLDLKKELDRDQKAGQKEKICYKNPFL